MSNIPHRSRLPETRPSITRKATVCGKDIYATVGFFDSPPEGWTRSQPAEVFVKIAKHGSELSGLIDGAAVVTSIAMQSGVPWYVIRDKFRHTRFGSGQDEQYSSILDGIAQMIDAAIADRKKIIGEDEPEIRAHAADWTYLYDKELTKKKIGDIVRITPREMEVWYLIEGTRTFNPKSFENGSIICYQLIGLRREILVQVTEQGVPHGGVLRYACFGKVTKIIDQNKPPTTDTTMDLPKPPTPSTIPSHAKGRWAREDVNDLSALKVGDAVVLRSMKGDIIDRGTITKANEADQTLLVLRGGSPEPVAFVQP